MGTILGTTFVEGLDKEQVKKDSKELLKRIGELQYKMQAQQKYSLLIVFQGLDASGKDGLTRQLLRYCTPTGFSVTSYKKPTPTEYSHDFLWRIHRDAPQKGELKVFIRSHYEDILVPTVEKIFPTDVVDQRYELINNFEKQLAHNDTIILKFFLNVSADAQEERLQERLENPEKYWKHNDKDWDTRKKTAQYLEVYKQIIAHCNVAPWYNIPADTNWQKTYYVAKKVLETLEALPLEWPALETERFGNKS